MTLRREAREIAIQTLYALYFDLESSSYDSKILKEIIEEKISETIGFQDRKLRESQIRFIEFLVHNTCKYLKEIDNLIKKYSENWDFRRISVIDKSLLRMSIMELEYTETNGKIIINEAVEIAKDFCGTKSSKFINGILNTVMHREK